VGPGRKTVMDYFSCSVGAGTDLTKSVTGSITPNMYFSSYGIYEPCSAFKCV
jgi:hypothetical protein